MLVDSAMDLCWQLWQCTPAHSNHNCGDALALMAGAPYGDIGLVPTALPRQGRCCEHDGGGIHVCG